MKSALSLTLMVCLVASAAARRANAERVPLRREIQLGIQREQRLAASGPMPVTRDLHRPERRLQGARAGTTYDIVVYPHCAATNAFDGAQVVRVTVVP